MGERRQLLAVERIGLGLVPRAVARNAPARVDADRGDGKVPANAQPAVLGRGIIGDRQLGAMACPARGQLDRIGEAHVAHGVGLGGRDQVHLGAGVGDLDVLELGGVEGGGLGRIRRLHHRVDHVREVGGQRDDLALRRIGRGGLQWLPLAGLPVEVEGLDVAFLHALGQLRLVVGKVHLHGLLEFLAVGQEAVARGARTRRARLGHIDHAVVERRQIDGAQGVHGDARLLRERVRAHLERRPLIGDELGSARHEIGGKAVGAAWSAWVAFTSVVN